MSRDEAAVAAFREDAGLSYPLYFGFEAEARAAHGLQQAPAVQVLDERGEVVGRDLLSLRARLQ